MVSDCKLWEAKCETRISASHIMSLNRCLRRLRLLVRLAVDDLGLRLELLSLGVHALQHLLE